MYTICEIKGKQYQIEEGKEYRIDYLGLNEGSDFTIDKVLLVKEDNGSVQLGKPYIDKMSVAAKVVSPEIKGDKVIAFKYKRRKGQRRKVGHRQKYSVIKIEKISR